MLAPTADPSALFALIGGWDIVGIVALTLMIFTADRLPELGRGMRQGLSEFLEAFDI
jgi:Sec-independent protein translocase protein TatA